MAEVQRYISSSFWSDDWVDSLSISGKLLYMYLLTNESTTIAGVYRITLKRMKDDTGIPRDEIQALLKHFEERKKAFYFQEYIILPKWPKHQKIRERTTIYLGMISCLKALPGEIQSFLMQDPSHYWLNLAEILQGKQGIPHSQKAIPYSKNYVGYCQNAQIPDTLSDDSDSDSDIDLKSNGGSYTESEQPETTTTAFSVLQEEIKNSTGFLLDEKILAKLKILNLRPEDSAGPLSFFAYAKEVIETKYPGKSATDQRTLFISAITTWENLRAEYPIWKSKKEKVSATAAVKKAKMTPPEVCDCGGIIKDFSGRLVCENCKVAWMFSEGSWGKIEQNASAHFDLGKIRKTANKNTELVEQIENPIPDHF